MNNTVYIILIIVALLLIYLVSLPREKENFLIVDLKEKLTVIDPRFKDIDIRESNASYTEDKSIIYMCMRDENGNVYPTNTLLYVALHEIAHMLNIKNYGHTPEFHAIFDKLLCDAAKKGLYDPEKPHPTHYCGVNIQGIKMPQCPTF